MKNFTFLISCISIIAAFGSTAPLVAAEDGESVFNRHCVACHSNGGNMMNPAKTLSKAHLQQYDRFSTNTIYNVLMEGVKGTAMMSFKHLDENELKAVTGYVMKQAEAGWP